MLSMKLADVYLPIIVTDCVSTTLRVWPMRLHCQLKGNLLHRNVFTRIAQALRPHNQFEKQLLVVSQLIYTPCNFPSGNFLSKL